MESIVLTIDNKADDFRRVLLRQTRARLIAICVFLLLSILLFGGGAIYLALYAKIKDTTFIFLFAFIPILIVAFNLYFYFRNISKQSKTMEESAEKTECILSEDGVELKSDSSSSKTAWSNYHKIEETATDFLFFLQKNMLFAIPKRFFYADQTTDLRALLIKQNGVKAKLIV